VFLKNTRHLQQSLFGLDLQLPEAKQKKLMTSKEALFYKLIFCNIHEEDFSILYSSKGSRPNAPLNTLASAIILQSHNGWTVEELLNRIDFDLLTRYALGINNIEDTPFCQATYFNFQNKIAQHFGESGENPLEKVFDHLTAKQLKELKIKTDIQRTDSFQALSNIRTYSRVQLLIEVLIRLSRILSEQDTLQCKELLSTYCSKSSSQYVYTLKRDDFPHELAKLGALYHKLYTLLHANYSEIEGFKVFERVYREHFVIEGEAVVIITPTSSSLQSPDDLDATFRHKNEENFHGEVVSVVETANPGNAINLITDVVVCANNVDDSVILNDRLELLAEKTPELNELHTDGGYGSSGNDLIMEKEEINHIQTAVRGREAAVNIVIDNCEDGGYTVSCPQQTVHSEKTKTRYKAVFDSEKCNNCANVETCQVVVQKTGRVFYFDEEKARMSKRVRNIENIPEERRRIRPNVEATMKEFTKPFNHRGKLRVRGLFKTMIFAFTRAIAINFGRIFRLVRGGNPSFDALKACFDSLTTTFGVKVVAFYHFGVLQTLTCALF